MVSFGSYRVNLKFSIILLCLSILMAIQVFATYKANKKGFASGYSLRNNCYKINELDIQNVCMPNILVAGYQKCGTSALYYMLQKHPSILGHPLYKETCPSLPDSNASLTTWLSNPRMVSAPDHELGQELQVLNGCLALQQFPKILRHLDSKLPNLKIVISVRDIAEFAFSYYNYRCYEGYDKGCSLLKKNNEKGNWTETRSPENFDKLLKNIENGEVIPGFEQFKPQMDVYSDLLNFLYKIVKREQVLIIKQEDLKENTRTTLKTISAFLGIKYSAFPESTFSVVSNTRQWPNRVFSRPGYFNNQETQDISVVPKRSKSVLYRWWRKECSYLKTNENIHYKSIC